MAEDQGYSGQVPMDPMVLLVQTNFQLLHSAVVDLTTQLGKLDGKVTAQLSKLDDKVEAVSERVRALEIANAARATPAPPAPPAALPHLAPGAGVNLLGASATGALRSTVPPPPARPPGPPSVFQLGLPPMTHTVHTAGAASA